MTLCLILKVLVGVICLGLLAILGIGAILWACLTRLTAWNDTDDDPTRW